MPYKCDDPRVDKWAVQTLAELMPIATTSPAFQSKETAPSPVELVPSVYFYDKPVEAFDDPDSLPEWTQDPQLRFEVISVDDLMKKNEELKLRIPPKGQLVEAGFQSAWLFYPPIIDTAKMLEKMVDEVTSHPLMKENKDSIQFSKSFSNMKEIIDEAKQLGCTSVINCTGMGASSLLSKNGSSSTKEETSLIGGRGILIHYDRKDCARIESIPKSLTNDATIFADEPWGTDTEPCYLIPRGDLLVVGGSYFKGDTYTGIREGEMARLLKNAKILGIDTSKVTPSSQWTGFRPCRPMIRLERDDNNDGHEGIDVIHSYGHGGSGWTIYSGVAKAAVDLMMTKSNKRVYENGNACENCKETNGKDKVDVSASPTNKKQKVEKASNKD